MPRANCARIYRHRFPAHPPARIFIVPASNGGFDIEVDCRAAD
jgi:hypothetical protein